MRFQIRSLFLLTFAAALLTTAYLFWDGAGYIKSVGHRNLSLTIHPENSPKKVSRISYTTLDQQFVGVAIEAFPDGEFPFTEIRNNNAEIDLTWTSSSSRSGKELSYHEYFDTILCRIVYADQSVEFRTVAVPQNYEKNELHLKL